MTYRLQSRNSILYMNRKKLLRPVNMTVSDTAKQYCGLVTGMPMVRAMEFLEFSAYMKENLKIGRIGFKISL